MKITILGNNAALPAYGRHPTAQIIDINSELFLMDCGEATQMQMQKYNIRFLRIKHIFISHMHGDHYFGLIGFINTLALLGKESDLHIYAPAQLQQIIQLQCDSHLSYKIHFHSIENNTTACLLSNEKYEVACFPVKHSIPTHGFIVTEKKRKRILNVEALRQQEIPKYFYKRLTDGEDYKPENGRVIKNGELTYDGIPNKKYGYSADTVYNEEIIPHIQGVDVLYHETTYTSEQIEKATQRMHSTAAQAATIAMKANVKKLIIGHFSSKYKLLDVFMQEAKEIFENTELAIEGSEFII